MKFKLLFAAIAPICAFFAIQSSLYAATPKPNVVIFLTDDQGWGDLSLHGNTNLSTPHIDGLARLGAQFDNFYVCQVCAPTRAEFLTGRYHPKTGVIGVSRGQGRLNPDETTIAEIFKAAGYKTGCFGKWHNGTQPPYHPNDRGFDEYYGFTSGHWGHYFSPPLDHNGQEVKGRGFVIDDFTDRAIDFINQHQHEPFFCYLPYNTPHSPFYVPDRFYQKFEHFEPSMKHRDPKKEDVRVTRAALALCENIDWNVGRVLEKLSTLNLADNTIVVFFCDNGPNSFRWNGQMKGKKGAIDEGGLRSPLFIRWPAKIKPQMIHTVTGAIDLLPTLSKLAGIPVQTQHTLDGVDISPLLEGKSIASIPGLQERLLYSIRRDKVSVRSQRFRLDSFNQLFEIEKDRAQRHDVADQYPSVFKKLKAASSQYAAENRQRFKSALVRPFTVGYGVKTKLTARDGTEHGTILRSSKSANNSFFKQWTSTQDAVTWPVDIGQSGEYEVILRYTCAERDKGTVIKLSQEGGDSTEVTIQQAFDPPLYDKSKERVPAEMSHYYLKDFKPVSMGRIKLTKGHSVLRLSAPKIPGKEAVNMISITLIRK